MVLILQKKNQLYKLSFLDGSMALEKVVFPSNIIFLVGLKENYNQIWNNQISVLGPLFSIYVFKIWQIQRIEF